MTLVYAMWDANLPYYLAVLVFVGVGLAVVHTAERRQRARDRHPINRRPR